MAILRDCIVGLLRWFSTPASAVGKRGFLLNLSKTNGTRLDQTRHRSGTGSLG
jgi:hypothetical protein